MTIVYVSLEKIIGINYMSSGSSDSQLRFNASIRIYQNVILDKFHISLTKSKTNKNASSIIEFNPYFQGNHVCYIIIN